MDLQSPDNSNHVQVPITTVAASACTTNGQTENAVVNTATHVQDGVEHQSLLGSKVMIIDDEKFNSLVAKKYLANAGFHNQIVCTDSTQAFAQIKSEKPDVILLDIMMPEVSGLDILRMRQCERDLKFTPVIVLTASTGEDIKRAALDLGATDFLAKPVDSHDLIPRVRNALLIKAHHDSLQDSAAELNRQVKLRTEELVRSREEIIHCLGRASEYRDNETGRHVIRVAQYSGVIAEELGCDKEFVEMIRLAAQLHDIGKIGIRDDILLSPGKLTTEQFTEMKKHSVIGREIICPSADSEWMQIRAVAGRANGNLHIDDSPLMSLASSIAYTHHEKWDGSGYPRGLKGEDIPLEGRITAVADVFDALSSQRPYKKPFPLEKCVSIIHNDTGSHFDPRCVKAFFDRLEDILQIQYDYSDSFPE